jgi:hypothetical protein
MAQAPVDELDSSHEWIERVAPSDPVDGVPKGVYIVTV